MLNFLGRAYRDRVIADVCLDPTTNTSTSVIQLELRVFLLLEQQSLTLEVLIKAFAELG